MTSAALVAELLRMDPEGTTEVTISSQPIWFVDILPAYYDGRMMLLHNDERGCPVGAEYTSAGRKIVLRMFDLEEWLMEYPEFPVASDGRYAEMIERWRQDGRDYAAKHKESTND